MQKKEASEPAKKKGAAVSGTESFLDRCPLAMVDKVGSYMGKKRLAAALLMLCMAFWLGGCESDAEGELTRQGMEAVENLDYEGALAKFEQALSAGEDELLLYRGAGMAYMGLAQYEQAVRSFDKALSFADSKMPNTVEDLLLYKASAQFRLKDYEATAATCDQLTRENEEGNVSAFYLRGASYLCLGYQDRAREDFDRAVALTPGDYTLYLNIYESYEAQNLSGIGDEYLQTALSIEPQEANDYYCIGQIYYYLEQYDRAQSALMTPLAEDYLPAMNLMGRIYLAQEDYARAENMYESIREKFGESGESFNGLALCALAAGEYGQALEYIEQGLSLDDENARQELLFNEIVAYERMLDFAAAQEKAQEYAALYPTDEAGQKELQFLNTR